MIQYKSFGSLFEATHYLFGISESLTVFLNYWNRSKCVFTSRPKKDESSLTTLFSIHLWIETHKVYESSLMNWANAKKIIGNKWTSKFVSLKPQKILFFFSFSRMKESHHQRPENDDPRFFVCYSLVLPFHGRKKMRG